jgi:hypothetical protein
MKYPVFIALFLCFFLFFSPLYAQLGGGDINVDMIPENPGPNEKVLVNITSFGTNLDAANIIWKINGKTQSSGTGIKSFTFTVGGMNSSTKLDIIVNTIDSGTIQKSIDIKPSSVDLIWQSDSFTPPFYKGKALFSYQNKITFIAMPHITGNNGEIPSKSLIYKWTLNGQVKQSDSGYGKNTYSFIGPLLSRPLSIQVEVSSADGGGSAYNHTTVTPVDPSIILYRKDPLNGIEFQKALLGNADLNGSEITITGMPYFFGLSSQNSDLAYKWSINNVPIGNSPSDTTEVFRKQEGVDGTSRISLSIENNVKILQLASVSFNLNFNNSISNQPTF